MRVKTSAEWLQQRDELIESLQRFAKVMETRPFANRQGLRGVSAFALYWFVSRIAPSVVFEVGVWRGFSTWLIEQAAPNAEVHCFDPLFVLQPYVSRWKLGRTYRSPRARYSSDDFSCAPIREIAAGRDDALAFFDDHQNKLPRLRQCRDAGIKHVVFDDNLPTPYTHRTLEHERAAGVPLEDDVEVYETFPALWPVHFDLDGVRIEEAGLDFPTDREFRRIYRDRHWHSYVTYVRLR